MRKWKGVGKKKEGEVIERKGVGEKKEGGEGF